MAVRCRQKLLYLSSQLAQQQVIVISKGSLCFLLPFIFQAHPPRERVTIARPWARLSKLFPETRSTWSLIYSHYCRPTEGLCGRGWRFCLLNGNLCSHHHRIVSMWWRVIIRVGDQDSRFVSFMEQEKVVDGDKAPVNFFLCCQAAKSSTNKLIDTK